ncbi:hypothetical protein BDK51DRAFT_19333 [Blyttiomyces helicus]|uniref:BAR domain-containing protein n=1 Tax=Blyttiomyces helicus TaxID=388810 RepID=A0A4P9WFR7_9FUNG|nr:hypothetical protein BDK51DRAFT_19333 [Blyttiomyces helicus]|eukprot:RKO90168.1 hypothetical protein BDK51DRAFT_19333 [Blyttiomyces helicus]
MSWKGFQKAVARLPQRIAAKAGYADETVDDEYNALEAQFKLLEASVRKLHADAQTIKDAMSACLVHQLTFANTIVDLHEAASPTAETPPESLRAAETFAAGMASAREQLLPDLDIIERQVIAPTADYLALIERVKRLMTKRGNKLLDYDRHRESVKKMMERTDRNYQDEKKLGGLQTSLDQATREYNGINNLLKTQLPVFFKLRVAFIDPCFQTLYWHQLKVTRVLNDAFRELVQKSFDTRVSAADGFALKEEAMLEMLSQLSLVRRPVAKGAEYGDPTDTGYEGSPDKESPTDGSAVPPPAYDADESPRIQTGKPFSAVHTGVAPPGSAASPSSASSPGSTQYVVALYDYESQSSGDLSFARDDKIEVVTRTENVNDWWTGRLRGKVGQFPGNYVAQL